MSMIGTIVPWKGHCALVISEFADAGTVTVLAWDGDGNASVEWNVKKDDVDKAKNPPAPPPPPNE